MNQILKLKLLLMFFFLSFSGAIYSYDGVDLLKDVGQDVQFEWTARFGSYAIPVTTKSSVAVTCREVDADLARKCRTTCNGNETTGECLNGCRDARNNFCNSRAPLLIPTIAQLNDLQANQSAQIATLGSQIVNLESAQTKLHQQILAFSESVNTIPEKVLKIQASKDFKAAVRKQVECEVKNIKADIRTEILVELGKPVPAPKPKINCDVL